MARPKKTAQERRDKRVVVNFNESEWQQVESIAKELKLPVSEYLRTMGMKKQIKQPDELTPQILRNLALIGSNLNQIARRLNSGCELNEASKKGLNHAFLMLDYLRDHFLDKNGG